MIKIKNLKNGSPARKSRNNQQGTARVLRSFRAKIEMLSNGETRITDYKCTGKHRYCNLVKDRDNVIQRTKDRIRMVVYCPVNCGNTTQTLFFLVAALAERFNNKYPRFKKINDDELLPF